jgi:hypothetical protein
MLNPATIGFWVVVVILAAVVLSLLWPAFFSKRARQRRHQRSGYGRVRDRRHGPAVQLNVKFKKDKDRRR